MGCRLLGITDLPTQNTTIPFSPMCFIVNLTKTKFLNVLSCLLYFSRGPETVGVRHLSNLIAQTPPAVPTETQALPKCDHPSAFRHKGLFGVFLLEEYFLQQTFQPNNSTCQIATGKSQPSCKKHHKPQNSSVMTNTSNITRLRTEIVGQRFVIEGRSLQH